MTRHIFIFLATFVAGGLIALVARAAWFKPSSDQQNHATAGGGDYAAMVSNPLAPAATATPTPATKSNPKPSGASGGPVAVNPHAGHNATAPSSAPSASATPAATATTETAKVNQPVNTLCAICGMDVDPSLPTVQYQGKTIGFGCRMCPPKFEADPDRYGPAYLKNEVIKR